MTERCVDFHPTFGGIVGASGQENATLDKRIDDSERLLFRYDDDGGERSGGRTEERSDGKGDRKGRRK